MNEVEEFLKDTEVDPLKVDVLDAPLVPEAPKKEETLVEGEAEGTNGEDAGDKDGLQPRNRRERRLMAKLQAEKESSMFLAGKLEARTEAAKAVTEEADYLKAVERIYGTDSPEALLATDLLKKAIVGARDDAENRAYERVKAERLQESQQYEAAQTELDNIVEEIEDEYGVTLTPAQETAFFKLLEKMSPKDKDGSVREYADPHSVYEVFQEKLKARPVDTRAKDLSSRSMTNSGSPKSNLQDDVHARFLREQGII